MTSDLWHQRPYTGFTCRESARSAAIAVVYRDAVSVSIDAVMLQLESNAGPIPAEQLKRLPSFPATAPDADLRAAYERDGVVHIKRVISPDVVWDMRRQ